MKNENIICRITVIYYYNARENCTYYIVNILRWDTIPGIYYLQQFRNIRNHFKEEQDDLNILSNLIFVVTLLYCILLFLLLFFFLFKRDDSAFTASSHSSVKRFDGRNVNRMKRGRFLLYTK